MGFEVTFKSSKSKGKEMNEYLWQELINHRHDIMIPVLIVYITALYYLNKWDRRNFHKKK